MKKRIIILNILLGVIHFNLAAQVDPHFSQYYVYPSWLNPALTGAFDGSYRISGIYRSQWGSVVEPFNTKGVSADFTTNKNLNLGISLINQTAGDGGYYYTTAYANFAYTGVKFGENLSQRIVFGMQAGIINRGFTPSRLTFGDQWNPVTGYSSSNPTNDILQDPSSLVFDAGAGVLYFDGAPNKKVNLFAGGSVSHLTKPTDKFLSMDNSYLPLRTTLHAGMRIKVSEVFSLTPNFLYLSQGTANEVMGGIVAQIEATDNAKFYMGLNYRIKDAISPYMGFSYKNMLLGMSYDVNNGDLGRTVKGANSFEISLSIFKSKGVKTPDVDFICPRL